jgi:anti-sigma factor RsiW
MNCNQELLQAYLDRELDEEELRSVTAHLAGCRRCRRELSQLKLLWSDLSSPEEIEPHPALPFLRQQVLAQAGPLITAQEKHGYLESQKLAWSQLGLAVAYLPGADRLPALAKTTARKLPAVLAASLDTAAKAGRFLGRLRKGRGTKRWR